jgi:hypothetical protein
MKALPYPEIIPGRARFLDPLGLGAAPPQERGGVVPETGVSEVHRYPLRPPNFEEPLFPTTRSRRAVMEHLLEAPWLIKASELREGTGEVAHRREEPVEVLRREDGRILLVRHRSKSRGISRRKVVRILDRWRVVGGWWNKRGGVDRLVFRVLLSGGAVVDLALGRLSGDWSLIGVPD